MATLAAAIVATVVGLLELASPRTRATPLRAMAASDDMIHVSAGDYTPVFPPSPEEQRIPVAAFMLDRRPVTNAEFHAFVSRYPEWRKDKVARIAANTGYLSHWAGPTELGPNAPPRAPVTHVSWFADKAYCAQRGARLPTEAEWEYVASASATQRDARKDPVWVAQILEWYGRPANTVLRDVGGAPNYWGAEDMHGLVWEWVLDFNSALISGDAREAGDSEKMKFCGSGALAAADKGDYATFMRLAMRSSLIAAYTGGALGFRCARDEGNPS
jgi:formylglycine-generating enzyme